jgi:hypothetical protein
MVDNIENKYVLLNSKTTIVVAGQFHPGIFTPDWFEFHEIVSKEDCEKAKIKYIESSIIHIDFGWFIWFSDPQRIMIELNVDGYDDQMLDLLRSILTMFSYTKVSAVGINFHFSINMNAAEDWHAIGHTLAPKDIWKKSFGREDLHYGMKETAIQVDDFYGEESVLNIALKTANNINDTKHQHRLAIEFNNHFDIPDANANFWNDYVESVLGRYFEIKQHNTQGYKNMLSSIIGGAQ